jgi:hypothetical protein
MAAPIVHRRGHFLWRVLLNANPKYSEQGFARLWCNSDASVCYAQVFDEHGAMGKLQDIDGSFNGRHFDREIIVLCMRWYLRYKLNLRDLTEMMAERGLSLAHAPKEVPVGNYDHARGEAFRAYASKEVP